MRDATVHIDQQSIYHRQKAMGITIDYPKTLKQLYKMFNLTKITTYGPIEHAKHGYVKALQNHGIDYHAVESYVSEATGNTRCNTTTAITASVVAAGGDVIVLITENEALSPLFKHLAKSGKTVVLMSFQKYQALAQYSAELLTPEVSYIK